MQTRHVPLRTCVACRTRADKRQLVRIVRGTSGDVAPDPTGRAPGRGAYLCPRLECWEIGTAKGRLGRALKLEKGLSADARSALMAYAEAEFAAKDAAGTG
ncbi:MAG: YlxR family protein [Chloroflexi bacterium]|nr:YlxR family protein [Chloroflexota bacterium]